MHSHPSDTPARLTRKHFMALALGAVASSYVLTGCTWGAQDTPAAAASDLNRAVGSEAQSLRVWSALPFEHPRGVAAMSALISAFNVRYPQITVDVTVKSQADIDRSILQLPLPQENLEESDPRATLEVPDVVMLTPGASTTSLGGHLLPLQEFLTPTAKADLRFIEESNATGGSLYAVPLGAQAYTLAVNPTVLAKVGLTAAAATATFDGLLQACTALAAAGIEPFDVAWLDSDDYLTFMSLFTTQVSTREQIRGVTSLPVPQENIALAQTYLAQMQTAECFSRASFTRSGSEQLNKYAGGAAAFFVTHTPKQASRIFTAQPQTQLVPFPQVAASKHRDISYGGPALGFGITSTSKNRAAAGAFLAFLASPEGQAVLFQSTGIVPNLRSFSALGYSSPDQSYVPFAARIANVSLVNYWPPEVREMLRSDAVNLLTVSADAAALPGRITAALATHIAGAGTEPGATTTTSQAPLPPTTRAGSN